MKACRTMRQGKREEGRGDAKVGGGGGATKEGSLTVKILLTRGELEWLMIQLKEKGERKLEDVLEEIRRERERDECRVEVWRPTLESIMEIPEIQSVDDQ